MVLGVGCWVQFGFGRTETTRNTIWGSNLTPYRQKMLKTAEKIEVWTKMR